MLNIPIVFILLLLFLNCSSLNIALTNGPPPDPNPSLSPTYSPTRRPTTSDNFDEINIELSFVIDQIVYSNLSSNSLSELKYDLINTISFITTIQKGHISIEKMNDQTTRKLLVTSLLSEFNFLQDSIPKFAVISNIKTTISELQICLNSESNNIDDLLGLLTTNIYQFSGTKFTSILSRMMQDSQNSELKHLAFRISMTEHPTASLEYSSVSSTVWAVEVIIGVIIAVVFISIFLFFFVYYFSCGMSRKLEPPLKSALASAFPDRVTINHNDDIQAFNTLIDHKQEFHHPNGISIPEINIISIHSHSDIENNASGDENDSLQENEFSLCLAPIVNLSIFADEPCS